MSEFGRALPKGEGQQVWFDETMKTNFKSSEVETIYVERRVPEHLEEEAHIMFDAWLKSKGYDAEEL